MKKNMFRKGILTLINMLGYASQSILIKFPKGAMLKTGLEKEY